MQKEGALDKLATFLVDSIRNGIHTYAYSTASNLSIEIAFHTPESEAQDLKKRIESVDCFKDYGIEASLDKKGKGIGSKWHLRVSFTQEAMRNEDYAIENLEKAVWIVGAVIDGYKAARHQRLGVKNDLMTYNKGFESPYLRDLENGFVMYRDKPWISDGWEERKMA